MSESLVLYKVKDKIAFVKMNRPDKLNALNVELSAALHESWERFEKDNDALVAILSGAGKSFCAGADEKRKRNPADPYEKAYYDIHQAYPENGTKIFKPIIGAIHGYVLGAGYGLAIRGCDFTIAAESAMIGFPESRLGVALSPVNYLPYLPFKISLEVMTLSWVGGQIMDAKRAYEVGLVNKVVPDADLMNEAIRWAEMLKQIPPLYIKAIKYGHYAGNILPSFTHELDYMRFIHPQIISEDTKEGLAAFLEKRKPQYKGK